MKTEDKKKPEKYFFSVQIVRVFHLIFILMFLKIKFTALDMVELISIEPAPTEGASDARTTSQDVVDSDHASSSDDGGPFHEDINGNKAGACIYICSISDGYNTVPKAAECVTRRRRLVKMWTPLAQSVTRLAWLVNTLF